MNKTDHHGHRQRIRQQYLANGIESMPDHNVLELLLSLSIPQKDVKPIAYDLMNTFGSLENVMDASPYDLMKVKGVGEVTAVLISLVKDIPLKIDKNKNKSVHVLASTEAAKNYMSHLLMNIRLEQFAVITLDNKNHIIQSHLFACGSVNSIEINRRTVFEHILRDNAASVIIGHNHPRGEAYPSLEDIDFTLKIRDMLRTMNINLVDHIIVGEDEIISVRSNPKFMSYFD